MKINFLKNPEGNALFYPLWDLDDYKGIDHFELSEQINKEQKALKKPYAKKRFFHNNFDITLIKISGKEEGVTYESVRRYASAVCSFCKKEFIPDPSLFLYPEAWGLERDETLNAALEGFILTDYEYKYFQDKKEEGFKINNVSFILKNPPEKNAGAKIIKKNFIIAGSIFMARDLTNGPANIVNIGYIEDFAKQTAKKNKLKIKIFSKKELSAKKFNLLLAVGNASAEDPRLIEMNYTASSKAPSICLVGKGIIFDSGGLNLKPGDSLYEMKCDMSGAAVVLGLLNAASKMKLNVNITALLPLAENSLGKSSYRPGDIFNAYNGKSVVIKNTDAEGRLILADALSYSDERKYKLTVDFATLTGAAVIALGRKITAGYFRLKDENIKKTIFASSVKKGEALWELPLFEDYKEMLKDDLASIGNIGTPPREAGSIIGALFLSEFVKNKNWIHFDIAGPAFLDEGFFYNTKGGTGVMIRTMLDFFENYF